MVEVKDLGKIKQRARKAVVTGPEWHQSAYVFEPSENIESRLSFRFIQAQPVRLGNSSQSPLAEARDLGQSLEPDSE